MSLRIVLIGSGKVALQLANAFANVGRPIEQVFNRSSKGKAQIRPFIKGNFITDLSNLVRDADYYILAVSDDAIEELSNQLIIEHESAVICHTSGNVSMDVFQTKFVNYGCFYPLQSFTKEHLLSFQEIPIFISANHDRSNKALQDLANLISNRVVSISDEERSKLHVPAVFVNNFVNHIFVQAYDYCQQESLDFEHLIPLIEETVARIKRGEHPVSYQTGPAVRGDLQTIKEHRRKLKNNVQLRRLYNYITQHIINYHRENH